MGMMMMVVIVMLGVVMVGMMIVVMAIIVVIIVVGRIGRVVRPVMTLGHYGRGSRTPRQAGWRMKRISGFLRNVFTFLRKEREDLFSLGKLTNCARVWALKTCKACAPAPAPAQNLRGLRSAPALLGRRVGPLVENVFPGTRRSVVGLTGGRGLRRFTRRRRFGMEGFELDSDDDVGIELALLGDFCTGQGGKAYKEYQRDGGRQRSEIWLRMELFTLTTYF